MPYCPGAGPRQTKIRLSLAHPQQLVFLTAWPAQPRTFKYFALDSAKKKKTIASRLGEMMAETQL